jgi:hypothetical protein
MDSYQFPRRRILHNNAPFSSDLLHSLLEKAYSTNPPFTGYIRFSGFENLHFLLFFNGVPFAAGRFADSKPARFTIQELGGYLTKFSDGFMSVTLCETDQVLLKCMLLFLQKEPDIKAPASDLDLENIVRQIGAVGAHAMIALCRDKKINFFFFRDGKGSHAYYSDMAFKQPEEMTLDEAMLLYAFLPGTKVQAYIFRDVVATKPEDSSQLDEDSLYKLLTVGYLKDRRSGNEEKSPMPAKEVFEVPPKENPKMTSVILFVESGPLQGKRFTVALPCTIGRKECDVMLEDRLVSRRHAELKIIDHQLVLEDLASKNGTKVNDEKVATKQLNQNDLISIGPFRLRISNS